MPVEVALVMMPMVAVDGVVLALKEVVVLAALAHMLVEELAALLWQAQAQNIQAALQEHNLTPFLIRYLLLWIRPEQRISLHLQLLYEL